MRSDQQRLLDIQEAVQRIEKYARRGREAFEQDELIQIWIVYHLQIIGEAARALSEETCTTYPALPWKQMIGMRHILVHHYFGIDLSAVWSVVENDLEPLKENVRNILDALPEDDENANSAN